MSSNLLTLLVLPPLYAWFERENNSGRAGGGAGRRG